MDDKTEALVHLEAARVVVSNKILELQKDREATGSAKPQDLLRCGFLVKIEDTIRAVYRLIEEHGL